MNRCFVIQPFDAGPFDKRYDDVFAPAIKDAGFDPYRVDRDPSVSIPIDDIESGIENSLLCLAEITTDNPNVWFELGFAIAVPKEVVLICSDERTTKFPFDVQHRNIIRYKTEAPQDFAELRQKITARIKAIQKKQEEIGIATTISPVKDTEGLSQHEIVGLVAIMQNSFISEGSVSGWNIKEDMNKAGFTDIAVSLALRLLREKGMVYRETAKDENNVPYFVYSVTRHGEEWLMHNQDKLVLQKEPEASPDDVPF
jgi:predicted transcriptional regulator